LPPAPPLPHAATSPASAIDAKPEIASRRLLFSQSALEAAFAAAISVFQNMISFLLGSLYSLSPVTTLRIRLAFTRF
jgi:hypothetical protein